jgi:hypothetical protein
MKSSKFTNKYKFIFLFLILLQLGLIISDKSDAKNPNIILPPVIPMSAPGMVFQILKKLFSIIKITKL